MFDNNNSGKIDEQELQDMLASFSRDSSGFAQRIGNKEVVKPFNVIKTLFGDSDVVNFKEFEHFIKRIKTDLLKIEFDMYSQDGTITLKDFAYIITNYAHPTVQIKLGERIDLLKETTFKMTRDDFLSFHEALANIDEFDYAIKLYSKVLVIHLDKR